MDKLRRYIYEAIFYIILLLTAAVVVVYSSDSVIATDESAATIVETIDRVNYIHKPKASVTVETFDICVMQYMGDLFGEEGSAFCPLNLDWDSLVIGDNVYTCVAETKAVTSDGCKSAIIFDSEFINVSDYEVVVIKN